MLGRTRVTQIYRSKVKIRKSRREALVGFVILAVPHADLPTVRCTLSTVKVGSRSNECWGQHCKLSQPCANST